jgi:hypothetical protein
MGRKPRFQDLRGQVFGRLTVQKFAGRQGVRGGRYMFECACQCGVTKLVGAGNLRSGSTNSCGCLQKEQVIVRQTTHGYRSEGRRHSAYWSWSGMIQRCTNSMHPAYRHYGGAGIKVAPEWMTFEGFIASLGVRPEGKYSLGRILDMGDYTEGNAVWQTDAEQKLAQRNKRALLKWAEAV